MNCVKYQALGNDYWVYDPKHNKEISEKIVKKLCDRHYGLGGDGVLVGPKRVDDAWKVNIYNSDGSLAEISGNGLTIFSRYLQDVNLVGLNEAFYIQPSPYCKVKVVNQNYQGNIVSKIALGKGVCSSEILWEVPEYFQQLFELPSKLSLYKVNMGNPHCVVPVNNPTNALACQLGKILEKHEAFPERTNVQFVRWNECENRAVVEIFERGSGYTLGSGSSACAVACAYGTIFNKTTYDLKVQMPGGNLIVSKGMDGFSFLNSCKKIATIEQATLFFE